MANGFTEQDVSVGFAQQLVADMPGDFGPGAVSPVYMDGVDIDLLRGAIDGADFRAGARQSPNSRFWATPSRLQSDSPIRDVFEIDLAVPRLVNRVAFDLAHFPHRAQVEYSETTDGPWLPLVDDAGRDMVIETVDSNPPILAQNANVNLVHPHHFGAGHWVNQERRLRPVSALRFRVVLTRPNGGTPPTDSQGNRVPYSLGVRSFVVGYEIDTEVDIPPRPFVPGSITTRQPIEGTRDLLGSSVSYAKRENAARNLLSGGVWRSAPQPLPYAVVNFYIDVRSLSNTPTVVDRIFVDPVTSGCSVNLYYTDQQVDFNVEDPFDFVVWTPVARDFALRRGFMRFAPTRATFFKMEFTDLAPEPYDANTAIVRKVKLFPGGLESRDPISRSGNDGGSGTRVSVALDGILRFGDNERPVTSNLTDLSAGYSPTEVFYSKDPAAAGRLADLSEHYNYVPWQGGTQAPHWPGSQTHPYIETEVLHDHRVAFFVALSGVTPYRLDYSFEEDTDQYLEYFFDSRNFVNEGWVQEPQDMETPGSVSGQGGPYRITSRVLKSRSNVRGIQFATTQSPPLQLLPDDDFNSGIVTGPDAKWLPVSSEDEAPPEFTVSNEFSTDIGTTVRIKRQGATEVGAILNGNLYREIGRNHGTYGVIMDKGLTYNDLARVPTPAELARFGGIKSARPISPAYGARVYLAARVFSKVDLATPVYAQIFDEESGEVVAETPADIQANKIVEWYTSYDAAAVLALARRTYSEVAQAYTTYAAMDGITWDDLGSQGGGTRGVRLTARLVQKGLANASFFADTVSLFEESILWEFSNDGGATWHSAPGIRNNPNGVLLFPAPNDTAYLNTYESIEGRDPDPNRPTYGQLANTRYMALEHEGRIAEPNRRQLMWRATCARGGQHINALSVRPWYVNQPRGVLSHEGVDVAGPNQALYDHFQPIDFDPRWRLWSKPIPQAWYFFYRQFTLLRHDDFVATEVGINTVLPEAFVVPRTDIVPATDVLGDALIIPVGGAIPPPEVPFAGTLVETLILPTEET